ncbi:hypothetical protein PS726_06052 [Pseudomonas fluorescens]|uniref:hypothetical protein n=1 Tax=Pseudomonas fluorescens TaxID=294 RepID=UPI00123FF1FB|nr:hypothetical protein [Pseudomonas fluorescens]VVO42776.1 hypothetical protein PS726_06052 [Pseudomonas fluorescens]
MTKDQERSFIARLTYDGINMTFFDQILSSGHFVYNGNTSLIPPNIVTTFEAYDPVTQEMRPVFRRKTTTLVIHFQCYDDYYNMQILSEDYYQKYFSKDGQGVLGAFPAAGGDTTSFNLLDSNHQIITLDDLNAATATIHLKARNAGIIRKETWRDPAYSRCFTDKSGDIATFKLDILERHASTPQRSTPYT